MGWVSTRTNCPLRYYPTARRQDIENWTLIFPLVADISTVCLALPDLLLRVPRLHQSVHLRNPSTDRRRALASRYRLGDLDHGHLLRAHRFHQPVCSLQSTAGHVDWRGNMRGPGYPGHPELLRLGIVASYRPRVRRAAWIHALQDTDEGGDKGVRHRCAWAGSRVRAIHLVSFFRCGERY